MLNMSNYAVAIALLAVSFLAFQGEVAGQECPPNEIPNLCGTLCEPSCEYPNPNPEFCAAVQCTRQTEGCRCVNGTYRSADSECVPLDQCLTYRE